MLICWLPTGRVGVVLAGGAVDFQMTCPVIADVEDRTAAGLRRIVLNLRTGDLQVVGGAVGIDRAAATATWGPRFRRIGAAADGLVVADEAVEHSDRCAQPADRTTIGTTIPLAACPAKGALHDMDRILVACRV